MPGAPLTTEEREELMLRETIEGVDSALDFIPMVSPRLERVDHVRPIADIFVRAEREPVLACSSFPPQHSKTITIAHCLVRYMLRFPTRRNAYVSYAIDRAQRVGRQMLEIAQRAGLRLKVGNQGEWVLSQGGGLIITGIGGPITGDPVDGIFVVDDAHKDRSEANSATIRQNVIDYVTVTAAGRLHPCASMLVNGTRWHVGDIIGSLKESERREPVGWTFVNVPAIGPDGAALWAKHRPLSFLTRQRRILGEYDFAAEYLGQPIPDGGEIFHAPARYERPDADTRTGVRILVSCDPAVTAKANADYSAIVVGAFRASAEGLHRLDILDYRSMQVETPALVRELVDIQRKWLSPVVVEAVGAMKSVPQMMRQLDPRLIVLEALPQGDKLVRARPVAAAWNDGRVRVPDDSRAPWVQQFTRDVRQFTGVGDKHDDAVDALSQLWSTLVEMSGQRDGNAVALQLADSLPFGG
jgi:predicted phage terminase large subunit-like protein